MTPGPSLRALVTRTRYAHALRALVSLTSESALVFTNEGFLRARKECERVTRDSYARLLDCAKRGSMLE